MQEEVQRQLQEEQDTESSNTAQAARKPPMGGMGFGPGFNPAAVQLRKTTKTGGTGTKVAPLNKTVSTPQMDKLGAGTSAPSASDNTKRFSGVFTGIPRTQSMTLPRKTTGSGSGIEKKKTMKEILMEWAKRRTLEYSPKVQVRCSRELL